MIFSALFSFLGGSAFRMIWGEIANWFNKRQDHKFELDRMLLESKLEAERHTRNLEQIRLASEMKVTEITVAGDIALERAAADAFTEAQKTLRAPTGVKWVDAWNGAIRPSMATIALAMWVFALLQAGFIPSDWDRELIAGILGFYIADRTLAKRGK